MSKSTKRRRRSCPGCDEEFSGRQILRHHEEAYDSTEETYTCASLSSMVRNDTADHESCHNETHSTHSASSNSSDDSDVSFEIIDTDSISNTGINDVNLRMLHRQANIEEDDRRAFFDETNRDSSDESSGEEIDIGSESDNTEQTEGHEEGVQCNAQDIPVKISRWIALFILSWQSVCYISDRAVVHLVSFLKVLLACLGKFTPVAAVIANTIPRNVYGIRKWFGVETDSFEKYVVCTKCFSLYLYTECVVSIEGELETKECSHIVFPRHKNKHMRRKCSQPLLKKVRGPNGNVNLVPFKTYCYYPLQKSLKSLISRKQFLEKCEEWKARIEEPNVYRDVYDGKVWRYFKDEQNFFNHPHSLGLMINLDWFQPFKHVSYSVGAIYAVILNLPRSERFKKENTLLIGLIPNMKHEPPTNTFLEPLVEELQQGWIPGFQMDDGTSIRVALLCVGCDIPASRKLCGFLGHAATQGCNHCSKSFPGGVGEKCYGGFDRETWPRRSKDEHLQQCRRINMATTKSKKEALEREFGVRYSVLLELPYFDPLEMTVVDPMHNLFLGTTKHMINIWKADNLLGDRDMTNIQELVDETECPTDIGKIPNKIASAFGGFNADQFKNWTLLFSLYTLQNILPDEHLKCWQKFVLASKYLCTQVISAQNIEVADRLLLEFCRSFECLYGENRVTPNMHLHCHLVKFLENYGPIYSFWLFSFERDNGILGNYPVNMSNIEPQLMRRFVRESSWTGELQLALKSIADGEDESALAQEIRRMECRVKARGTLSKCEIGDVFHVVKKASRTCNIHETDWAIQHTSQNVVTNRRGIKSLTITETEQLRKMYQQLYQADESGIDTFIVPSSCYVSKELFLHGTVLGTNKSRSRRSSHIMAHWGEEGYNIISNGTCKPRPGEIELFLFHNLFINDEVKPHILAKVRWFKKAPAELNQLYKEPVQVWQNQFVEEGPVSYIPVQRIKSKFVCIKRVLNHNNVVVVIPREKYLV